jgi:hypothetical protein
MRSFIGLIFTIISLVLLSKFFDAKGIDLNSFDYLHLGISLNILWLLSLKGGKE